MNEPAALILRVELSSWEIMHNGQTDSVAEAARRYIHTRFRMWGSDELSSAGACGLCKDGNRERQPVAEEH